MAQAHPAVPPEEFASPHRVPRRQADDSTVFLQKREVEGAILQISPGNEAHLHAFATEMIGSDLSLQWSTVLENETKLFPKSL